MENKEKEAEEINYDNLNFFSNKKFKDLDISENTKKAILDVLKFEYLTHIQERTISYLLKGRDVWGAAKTGSGKTLAFMIPVIENLYKIKFTQKQGTGAIIITPTRELAQQIFNVTQDLLSYHNKTLGLLIGGKKDRKLEINKLKNGVNIIIATPGRLLDHLKNNNITYHNLINLVIDEADQLLKVGFEEEINEILNVLPKDRQTILFSATQTKKIEDLVRLSMKSPIYIGVDDNSDVSTVKNLEQGYLVCDSDLRFRILYTFLKKNPKKKIMVFFSTCNSVKFHSDLLNYVDIRVLDIHGKQKQEKRLNTFYEFCNLKTGILLCTDVASRGLDIPFVDWIIQYDPPDDVKEYIHRVGRTCRGSDTKGNALLFLLESEIGYLKYLLNAKVKLNEYEFLREKLPNIKNQFENLIENNYFLLSSAKNAYRSYLHSYISHSLKDVFNVNKIDLQLCALSFGLKNPPTVNLNINLKSKENRKYKTINMQNDKKKNYFNKNKNSNDKRQFSK